MKRCQNPELLATKREQLLAFDGMTLPVISPLFALRAVNGKQTLPATALTFLLLTGLGLPVAELGCRAVFFLLLEWKATSNMAQRAMKTACKVSLLL